MVDDYSGSSSTNSNEFEASQKPTVLPKVISSSIRITNDKFDGKNYAEWRKAIHMFRTRVEKEDHLIDDPPTSRTAKDKWLREDNRLFGVINKTLDAFVRHVVSHRDTVKEL